MFNFGEDHRQRSAMVSQMFALTRTWDRKDGFDMEGSSRCTFFGTFETFSRIMKPFAVKVAGILTTNPNIKAMWPSCP